MRMGFDTVWRAFAIVMASAALALGFNALSPQGIPLRPMTLDVDYPPKSREPAGDRVTVEKLQAAVELARMAAQLGPDAAAGLNAPIIVDARDEHEYKMGHIPTAIHAPYSAFLKGRPGVLERIPKGRLIIVYCDDPTCGASVIVAEQLRLYGYGRDDVRVFTGGFPEWEKLGLEVAL